MAEVKTPTKPTKVTKVKAVHGKMVHTLTGQVFTAETTVELAQVDSWVQSQIDAGKMIEVE